MRTLSRTAPPSSWQTGTPSSLSLMSHSAWSMPLSADIVTMPPLKNWWRYCDCQRCSMRVGSCPTTSGARSATAPCTARVFHSSVASPKPTRSGSFVDTLTNTQLRSCAPTTTVVTSVTITSPTPPAISSSGEPCAEPRIDGHLRAGHRAGAIAGQEGDDRGDLLRRGHPPERMAGEHLRLGRRRVGLAGEPLVHQARPGPPRAHRVEANTVGPELEREAARQADEPGLRRRVREHPAARQPRVQRRDVDDARAVRGAQVVERVL